MLETSDGGNTWRPRVLEALEDTTFNYRFNAVSFSGQEGWLVCKPSRLLHTLDGGKTWEVVSLSSKLPGTPYSIVALDQPGCAEMITDKGAIYRTSDTAQTWQAQVQEQVDATLNRTVSSGITGASYYDGQFSNINRSPSGTYVATTSRGNFYMTWRPGDEAWVPHNRPASRRVQAMGWTPREELWLATRGGDVYLAKETGVSDSFEQAKLGSRGFGILNIGFRNEREGYAVGGSGTLYRTDDGGKTWKRDKGADDVAGNLYFVKFLSASNGYILGSNGQLLKYLAA